MFGYVRPDRPELKIREYQTFRAHYCGLCLALARAGGTRARLTVSYEGTFLALLLASLRRGAVTFGRGRCPLPPWRTVPLALASGEQDYAADIDLLLAYHKLIDARQDRDMRLAAAAEWWLRGAARRAGIRRPREAALIRASLSELQRLEREGCADLDAAADPFARLLSILAQGPEDGQGRSPYRGALRAGLRVIGYNLGKWIYTVDAMADLEDDLEHGRYNPMIAAAGYAGQSAAGCTSLAPTTAAREIREHVGERVRFVLTQCLASVAGALDVLPLAENRGLLENIVYLGLPQQMEAVLVGKRGGRERGGSVRGPGFEAGGQRSRDQAGLPGAGEEVSPGSVPG